MTVTVGTVAVDLETNSANFQRDLGKATQQLNSAAASMNRSLASVERGFRFAARGFEDVIIKGALVVVGFASLRSAISTTIGTMRNMQEQADALGVTLESGVAASAAAGVKQIDLLSFAIRSTLASALTDVMRVFHSLRKELNAALTPDQAFDRIISLEREIREIQESGDLNSRVPGVAAGVRDRMERAQREVRELRAQLRRTEATDSVAPDATPAGARIGNDPVFDVIAALKFQEEQLGRTALQQRVWNELQRAGVDLSTEAGVAIMQAVHSLAAQEDALAGLNQQVIVNDQVYDEYIAGLMDDAAFEGLQNSIAAAAAAAAEAERNVIAWKETFASSAVDMLMRVNSVKDGVRALGREILAAGLRKFVVNGIIDAGATALGFGGARAMGGPVDAGTSYLVGERGPEIFTPGVKGNISPNSMLSGGGGGSRIIVDARGATRDAIREIRLALSAVNASIEPRARAVAHAPRRGR